MAEVHVAETMVVQEVAVEVERKSVTVVGGTGWVGWVSMKAADHAREHSVGAVGEMDSRLAAAVVLVVEKAAEVSGIRSSKDDS